MLLDDGVDMMFFLLTTSGLYVVANQFLAGTNGSGNIHNGILPEYFGLLREL